MGERLDELVARLRKGGRKTAELLGGLGDDQWRLVLYEGPPAWTVRDLLAHFLSAEEGLLRLAQDVAAGGPGVPDGFDRFCHFESIGGAAPYLGHYDQLFTSFVFY